MIASVEGKGFTDLMSNNLQLWSGREDATRRFDADRIAHIIVHMKREDLEVKIFLAGAMRSILGP